MKRIRGFLKFNPYLQDPTYTQTTVQLQEAFRQNNIKEDDITIMSGLIKYPRSWSGCDLWGYVDDHYQKQFMEDKNIFFLFFASPCATLRFGGVWRTLRLAPTRHTSFVLCVVRPWPALRASARATIKGQLREHPHARANQKPVSCTVAAAPRASFGPCAFLTANQRRALPETQGAQNKPFTPPAVVACA